MLTTVISFAGNCNEAISFYKEALGAEVKGIYYFKDAPENHGMDPSLPPDFVMHSEILIEGSMITMTDGAKKAPTDDNFSFMITKATADEVTALFHNLSEDGKVIEPLASVFWSPLYGYVEDQFGIHWAIML